MGGVLTEADSPTVCSLSETVALYLSGSLVFTGPSIGLLRTVTLEFEFEFALEFDPAVPLPAGAPQPPNNDASASNVIEQNTVLKKKRVFT